MVRNSRAYLIILFFLLIMVSPKIYADKKNWGDYISLACDYIELKQLKKAEDNAKKALAIAIKEDGPNHKNVGRSLIILGKVFEAKRDYSIAEKYYIASITNLKSDFNENFDDILFGLRQLGDMYQTTSNYTGAEKCYLEIINLQKNNKQKDEIEFSYDLKELAEIYKHQKRFKEAEELFNQRISIRERVLGAGHYETGMAYYDLAVFYSSINCYDKAEINYKNALKIVIREKGLESSETATIMQRVGLMYWDMDRFNDAEASLLISYRLRKKILGEKDKSFLESLDYLSLMYIFNEEYSKAEPYLLEKLDIKKRMLNKNHPEIAKALVDLSYNYFSQELYNKAEHYVKDAMNIYKQNPKQHKSEIIDCQFQLGKIYRGQNKFDQAEKLCKTVLAARSQIYGKMHPKVADILIIIARIKSSKRQYTEAEEIYLKAVDILRKSSGDNKNRIASVLNNLALIYTELGRFSEAEPLFIKSIDIRKSILKPNSEQLAQSYNNIAYFYKEIGQNTKAEENYIKSLEIHKSKGVNHPKYALALSALGDYYRTQNRFLLAEKYIKRSLEIWKNNFKSDNLTTASLKNSLAVVYIHQNKYQEAEKLLHESLSLRKKILGAQHPLIAQSLNNLASLYERENKLSEAEHMFKTAIAVLERNFGDNYPYLSIELMNLASLYSMNSRKLEAYKLMKRVMALDEKRINEVTKFSSEIEKLQIIYYLRGNYKKYLSLIICCFCNKPEIIRAGYNTVLNRKGKVIDAMYHNSLVASAIKTPEISRKLHRLKTISTIISNLRIKSKLNDQQENVEVLKRLYKEKYQLERELSKIAVKSEKKPTLSNDTSLNISQVLPKGSMLIEFINIDTYNYKTDKWRDYEYYAFILSSSQNNDGNEVTAPKIVKLGNALKIDNAVESYLKEINKARVLWQSGLLEEGGNFNRVSENGKLLYRLIWEPLKKEIKDEKNIYLSPAGTLNLLPFEALMDEKGNYIITEYDIRYISNGRDLLRKPEKGYSTNSKTIIIADPDYDKINAKETACNNTGNNKDNLSRNSGDLRLTKWKRLKGCYKEAEGIKKTLGEKNVVLITGENASEEYVKSVQSPYRLHIASHAFFIGNKKESRPDQNNKRIIVDIENPLVSSGIVLAGANERIETGVLDDREDGILTALEIMGLDLINTDLVVLSACDTGIGDIIPGEGVFGLRRAFQLAGADTIIMSLWKIPDLNTQEFMIEFYQRLKNGESKSEALRNSKLSLINSKDKIKHHPFFWASFIMTGK